MVGHVGALDAEKVETANVDAVEWRRRLNAGRGTVDLARKAAQRGRVIAVLGADVDRAHRAHAPAVDDDQRGRAAVDVDQELRAFDGQV